MNFEGSLITENSKEMVLSRTGMEAPGPAGHSFRISVFSESFYVLCGHKHFSLLMLSLTIDKHSLVNCHIHIPLVGNYPYAMQSSFKAA